jgi:hypothetical protein
MEYDRNTGNKQNTYDRYTGNKQNTGNMTEIQETKQNTATFLNKNTTIFTAIFY